MDVSSGGRHDRNAHSSSLFLAIINLYSNSTYDAKVYKSVTDVLIGGSMQIT